MPVAVAVGVIVAVPVAVGVGVLVDVPVAVAVAVAVTDAVFVAVGLLVAVGVTVAVRNTGPTSPLLSASAVLSPGASSPQVFELLVSVQKTLAAFGTASEIVSQAGPVKTNVKVPAATGPFHLQLGEPPEPTESAFPLEELVQVSVRGLVPMPPAASWIVSDCACPTASVTLTVYVTIVFGAMREPAAGDCVTSDVPIGAAARAGRATAGLPSANATRRSAAPRRPSGRMRNHRVWLVVMMLAR